jgi:hypothetical protein
MGNAFENDPPIKLYNSSCPPLPELLKSIERTHRHGAAVWRRALLLTLRRLGLRQEGLARVTAVEILRLLSMSAASSLYEKSGQAREIAKRFQAMEKRRYSRGDLTPASGHHPDVLRWQLRSATRALKEPLTRDCVANLWRGWGGGTVPARLWDELKARPAAATRALAFVAAASDCSEDTIKKTLQRDRRRRQQTR